MPTFTCLDCGGTVNELAESCPHCGLPREHFSLVDKAPVRAKEVVDSTKIWGPWASGGPEDALFNEGDYAVDDSIEEGLDKTYPLPKLRSSSDGEGRRWEAEMTVPGADGGDVVLLWRASDKSGTLFGQMDRWLGLKGKWEVAFWLDGQTQKDLAPKVENPVRVIATVVALTKQWLKRVKPRKWHIIGEAITPTFTCPDCGIMTSEPAGVCHWCENVKGHAPPTAKPSTPEFSPDSGLFVFGCLALTAVFFGVLMINPSLLTTGQGAADRGAESAGLVEAKLKAAQLIVGTKFLEQFKEDWNTYENTSVVVYLDASPKQHPRNQKYGWVVSMERAIEWAGTWMTSTEVDFLKATMDYDKVIWMENEGFAFEVIDD